jgi:hypothetical protein
LARPNVNLLAEVLDHLLERVVMVLRGQFFFRVVSGRADRAAACIATVNARLRIARVECANEARIVETVAATRVLIH